jgi:hypothetical protein
MQLSSANSSIKLRLFTLDSVILTDSHINQSLKQQDYMDAIYSFALASRLKLAIKSLCNHSHLRPVC